MKYVVNGAFTKLCSKIFFVNILGAAIVTFVIGFFWGIILNRNFDFMTVMKWLYILDTSVDVLWILGHVVLRYVTAVYLSRRLRVDFNEMARALGEFNLAKQPDFLHWTSEQFGKWYAERLMVNKAAEDFVEYFTTLHRN